MDIKNMTWSTIKWKYIKKHLGFTSEEMKKFRENPRNEDILNKAPELLKKTIVVEVIDSHGCNSQHNVGDKFYFDALGNLLTKKCPKKVCIHALHAITPQIFTANELLCAGVDPNEMRFKHAACFDVGLECQVVMETKVENR
jgi:uncharacterized repeat protein (TIGR04076 family)